MADALVPAVELVDSHAHLEARQFAADREEVIARAVAAGVTRIVNAGTSLPASEASIALAEAHANIYPAVGIHPHEAKTLTEPVWEALQALARRADVVAIGEIGLDFYYNLSTREQQVDAFRRQLALARVLGKPVIIHDRDAHAETLAILRELGPHRGVLHCFSGDATMAEAVLDLGYHIGVAGPVTFRNAGELPDIVCCLPLDRLLLETDAPYLAPHPHRGQRNEPAYVRYVAERVAALRGVSLAVVAEATTANAVALLALNVRPTGRG